MTDSYSFNTEEELNKIFYDSSTRTFVYCEDGFVCNIARHSDKSYDDFHVYGNQTINQYVEQTRDGVVYSFRTNPRSDKLIPLSNMRFIMGNHLLYYPMNQSMILKRDNWIERILSAKKKIAQRKTAQ